MLDSSIAALRGQADRDMQQQASLRAAAEAHACSVSDRDNCVREVAAMCGMSDLAGTSELLPAHLQRYSTPFCGCKVTDASACQLLQALKHYTMQVDTCSLPGSADFIGFCVLCCAKVLASAA